jgi:hypothetical protein
MTLTCSKGMKIMDEVNEHFEEISHSCKEKGEWMIIMNHKRISTD